MKDVVQDAEDVVSTLLVNSEEAKVLFDSEATKSFNSKEFVNKLQCGTQTQRRALIVNIPNQDRFSIKFVLVTILR